MFGVKKLPAAYNRQRGVVIIIAKGLRPAVYTRGPRVCAYVCVGEF